MIIRSVGKSLNRSAAINCMKPVVSKFGLHDELTCTIAGTSSSTSFSYNGYQYRSVSGGAVQWPPDGSGFRSQPMKPSSLTDRSSSAMQVPGGTPGDCGSWHTPTKLPGYKVHTR